MQTVCRTIGGTVAFRNDRAHVVRSAHGPRDIAWETRAAEIPSRRRIRCAPEERGRCSGPAGGSRPPVPKRFAGTCGGPNPGKREARPVRRPRHSTPAVSGDRYDGKNVSAITCDPTDRNVGREETGDRRFGERTGGGDRRTTFCSAAGRQASIAFDLPLRGSVRRPFRARGRLRCERPPSGLDPRPTSPAPRHTDPVTNERARPAGRSSSRTVSRRSRPPRPGSRIRCWRCPRCRTPSAGGEARRGFLDDALCISDETASLSCGAVEVYGLREAAHRLRTRRATEVCRAVFFSPDRNVQKREDGSSFRQFPRHGIPRSHPDPKHGGSGTRAAAGRRGGFRDDGRGRIRDRLRAFEGARVARRT